MKKRVIYLSLLLLLFVVGCKKDRDVAPGERPEERMAFALAELRENLLSAPYGWNAYMTTGQGNGFSFYFDFDESDRVISLSDFDDETSSVPFESGYRLRAVMAASLLFDTYSYIHLLADPNPGVAGGTAARGYNTDFEFEYYGSGENDSLLLVGKTRRMPFIMMPATQGEQNEYMNGEFKNRIADMNAYINNNTNLYFEINPDLTPAFLFNTATKKVVVAWKEDGEDKVAEVPYVYTLSGVKFLWNPLIEGRGLTHIDLLSSTAAKAFMNDGQEYDMGNSATPLLPLPLIFNYNGAFRELYIGADLPPGVTSGFNAAYQASVSKFAAMNPTRTLVDVSFAMTNSNTVTVTTRNNNGSSTFIARATYSYTYEDGLITLTNPSYDGNWTARTTQLIDIQNWFLSEPFRVDYVQSSDPSGGIIGGLYRVGDESDFFYGELR